MLLTNEIEVKVVRQTLDHYRNFGYDCNIGDVIKINPRHASKGCAIKIKLKCDYCGEEFEKCSGHYVKSIVTIDKNSCPKKECCSKKSEDVNMKKYGVKCTMELDHVKEKTRKNNLEKYGVDSPMKSQEVKDKLKQVMLDKYGVEYYSQTEEHKEKFKNTCLERYGTTSYLATEDCQSKSRQACMDKYGVEFYTQTGAYRREGSPRWKGGLGYKGDKRDTPDYRDWRKLAFERDNYTCQCCGIHGHLLRSHHIFNWRDNENLRFDVNNAITLCDGCHKLFHHLYGNRNTNDIQLNEFLGIYGKNIV